MPGVDFLVLEAQGVTFNAPLGGSLADLAESAPLLERPVDPGRILFVDDLEHYVEAARSLGLRAIAAEPSRDWIAGIDDLLLNRCSDAAGMHQVKPSERGVWRPTRASESPSGTPPNVR